MRKLYLLLLVFLIQNSLSAQFNDIIGRRYNTITPAVSFLLISPDPTGSAMGETGVATANDVYSLYWNPAKYGAISQLLSNDPSKDFRAALSYSPWLRLAVDDIWLGSFYASKLISEKSAISTSFRYFTLGDITFTNIHGTIIGNGRPVEWAADVAYSQRLSEHWSGGVAIRYIYSKMTSGQLIPGYETKPGMSLAADLSAYYEMQLGKNNLFSFGACIANIGSKISYMENSKTRAFIPTILRVGPSFYWHIQENHQFRFSFELDKLLVPTPPYYAIDSTGAVLFDANNEPVIAKGMSPDVSVLRGMVQSFYDAPEGLSEELHEITLAIGLEYRLLNTVSFRGGYFSEHESKGNRKYFTVSLGVKYKFIEAHLARIIDAEKGYKFADLFRKYDKKDGPPVGILHQTMRYSICFDLAGIYK